MTNWYLELSSDRPFGISIHFSLKYKGIIVISSIVFRKKNCSRRGLPVIKTIAHLLPASCTVIESIEMVVNNWDGN